MSLELGNPGGREGSKMLAIHRGFVYFFWNIPFNWGHELNYSRNFNKIMYRSIPKMPIPPPPTGQTPGHLTFLKNFGQIPHYVASLDGQMSHPPGKTKSLTLGNKFCKIFSHYEFLVQLVFAPHFKQRHISRYNYIKRQQQKNPCGIDKSNDPSMQLLC